MMENMIKKLEAAIVKDLVKLQELYALMLDSEQAQSCYDPKEYYITVKRDILRYEEKIAKNRNRYLMLSVSNKFNKN